jgi:two-component system LytT family response regulator
MKALVIDDEKKARSLLSVLIDENCPEVDDLLFAEDLVTGVEMIKEEHPDLVFLDIEMPQQSGLKILEYFPGEVDFKIIFTTAYNDYAIEAFKLSAVDYLLKPIDAEELSAAVQKAANQLEKEQYSTKLEGLKKMFRQLSVNKIAIEVPKGVMFVGHDEIVMMEADGMYTKVYLQKGETNLICKPLKHFVEQLDQNELFFRPHRSYLINIRYMKELSRSDGDFILMDNKKTVPISKKNKQAFLKVVNEVFW